MSWKSCKTEFLEKKVISLSIVSSVEFIINRAVLEVISLAVPMLEAHIVVNILA